VLVGQEVISRSLIMNLVDSAVRSVVQEFVRDGVLFTALDVSNKVKETLPLARHREVRDLVRMLYTSEIEPGGYARTPITVTLENGDTAEALLYHSLVDSWDLDAKYDAQKRAQTAKQPALSVAAVSHSVVVPASAPTPVAAPPAPVVTAPVQPAPKAVVAPTPATASSRALWNNLFKSQPSLFPTR
jgi:hypothetical protein